jgi:uncharacterized protein GlcG (DUF336 family)/NAD-dependent dihydropyrimidine dehydrogenase PreA subunit
MATTYVITEACIGVKDATCVDVCPAACIHTTPEAPQYYIDPDVCIACEQCVIVCPVQAIFLDDDVPEHLRDYIEINAGFFRENKAPAEPLSREEADAVVAAVGRYAQETGIAVAVTVVDPQGQVIVESEPVATDPEALAAARDRAYSAAALQLATHQAGRGITTRIGFEVPSWVETDRLVRAPGGFPVMEGDVLRGAIGVAGGPSSQIDLHCCQAGLAALKPPGH